MKFKNTQVFGLESSIIRSGYPMQVGEPEDLDTKIFVNFDDEGNTFEVSDLDEKRAKKLSKTPVGSGHNNFLKGIIVQFDLQYPEYFSPQLQRYNWVDIISSQSKMHRITNRELTREDFTQDTWAVAIDAINDSIRKYNKEDSKIVKNMYFNEIISNLPSGYLKWMGISTNYLQLKTIYNQRKHHKLQEWKDFCTFIEGLPMSNLIVEK